MTWRKLTTQHGICAESTPFLTVGGRAGIQLNTAAAALLTPKGDRITFEADDNNNVRFRVSADGAQKITKYNTGGFVSGWPIFRDLGHVGKKFRIVPNDDGYFYLEATE